MVFMIVIINSIAVKNVFLCFFKDCIKTCFFIDVCFFIFKNMQK